MHRDCIEPLINTQQITDRCAELGKEISKDYQGKDLVCIGLLNGVFPFFADLVRCIDMDLETTFMKVTSYAGQESTGEVRILQDLSSKINGRHVLLVEDIVDTGRTLDKVIRHIQNHGPASVKVASLLDKPSRRVVEVPVHYCGFVIEDKFVVGYGLDLDGLYRNIPYVGVYNPNKG